MPPIQLLLPGSRAEEERKAKDEGKTDTAAAAVESSSVAISVPSEPIYFGNSVY
jgi:hypothetical protein